MNMLRIVAVAAATGLLALLAAESADAFSGYKGRFNSICAPTQKQVCNTLTELERNAESGTDAAAGGASKQLAFECRNGEYRPIPASEVGFCGKWVFAGAFSNCSRVCDGGVKTRSPVCWQPDLPASNNPVPGYMCPSPTPPDEVLSCNTQACRTKWLVTQDWGQCTKSCGGGTENRTVHCMKERADGGGWDRVGDHVCAGPKPATSRACNTQACAPPSPPPPPPPGQACEGRVTNDWRDPDYMTLSVTSPPGMSCRVALPFRDGAHGDIERVQGMWDCVQQGQNVIGVTCSGESSMECVNGSWRLVGPQTCCSDRTYLGGSRRCRTQ